MRELLVGADIGGTSTKVGVATSDGRVVSLATGGPGNPNTVGLDGSAAQIHDVIDRALQGLSGNVVAVVIGLAGGSRAAAEAPFLSAAVPHRVAVRPTLVSDLNVAFSTATPAPQGYVIVAGTGSVAGHIVGADLVARRDGWGWLLGDQGSGYWLGREAVRSTLAALDHERELTPLQTAVLDAAASPDYLHLIQACYSHPPTWLSQFAPLVSQHADTDRAAGDIAQRAAQHLVDTVLSLKPQPSQPLVLGGSVLTTPGPVARHFRTTIAQLLDNPVLTARTGVVGALWIAARTHGLQQADVHARLAASAREWRGADARVAKSRRN